MGVVGLWHKHNLLPVNAAAVFVSCGRCRRHDCDGHWVRAQEQPTGQTPQSGPTFTAASRCTAAVSAPAECVSPVASQRRHDDAVVQLHSTQLQGLEQGLRICLDREWPLHACVYICVHAHRRDTRRPAAAAHGHVVSVARHGAVALCLLLCLDPLGGPLVVCCCSCAAGKLEGRHTRARSGKRRKVRCTWKQRTKWTLGALVSRSRSLLNTRALFFGVFPGLTTRVGRKERCESSNQPSTSFGPLLRSLRRHHLRCLRSCPLQLVCTPSAQVFPPAGSASA